MHNSILIVESDHDIAMLLVTLLRAQDCCTVTAPGGCDALELLDHGSPALVFVDARLPDMPLDEFVEELRTWCDAPLVLMSTSVDGQRLARHCGADAFLPLPFELPEVLECLYLMPPVLERSVG